MSNTGAAEVTTDVSEVAMPVAASPARLAWRRLRKNWSAVIGGVLLLILYGLTLFGSFFQVAAPSTHDYAHTNHPPTIPRFIDESGRFHIRPFVYGMDMVDAERQVWQFNAEKKYPLQFFERGEKYKLWWIFESDLHLVSVESPGLFAPLGTDGIGRCVWSRTIEGGKVSLSIGLAAIAISLSIGMFMGGMAGYYGGLTDSIIMRLVEFLLSIPSLYLIIALRAYFQTEGLFGIGGGQVGSGEMYLIIVVILSFIGWAGQARVIRGMVLSIKEQDFITAERALGASMPRILAFHVLPNTFSYVIVSATIAIPGYILGEVALSFLGVGIQDPQVSWGNMLEQGRSMGSLLNFPWLLLAPSIAIFLTVIAFNFLGDGLRDALDPKHVK